MFSGHLFFVFRETITDYWIYASVIDEHHTGLPVVAVNRLQVTQAAVHTQGLSWLDDPSHRAGSVSELDTLSDYPRAGYARLVFVTDKLEPAVRPLGRTVNRYCGGRT